MVDATQGVQAQTLANLTLARKQNLTIIPIINKIDLPNAQVEEVTRQLVALGFKRADVISISAKTGKHIDQVLNAIIERIPAPWGKLDATLRALVFSSQYDPHKGVVVYVRLVDGSFHAGPAARFPPRIPTRGPLLGGPPTRVTRLKFIASGVEFEPIEIGYFSPQMQVAKELGNGEVGYIATGLKEVTQAKIGDTITVVSGKLSVISSKLRNLQPTTYNLQPLPGYKEPKPMVFLGLYPIQTDEIQKVRDALGKLRLSDSAFTYRPISSVALGNGFHCGFLGLLHAEVVQERLSREFNLSLLATAPTVEYKIKLKNMMVIIQSATEFPDPSLIESSYEPMMQLTIFAPKRYVGAVMQLCQNKRGAYIDLEYVGLEETKNHELGLAKFTYLMPLSEMIVDFFDQLKSVTEGYASLDYELFDYSPVDLVHLDILINHVQVDAFSQLVVKEKAEYLGRVMAEKLSKVIPRHQFLIPIQATIGGKIIARADVKPFRKDVTQKLYGGDRTRKDKLLEAQKKGKQKMKQIGAVEVPQNAFLEVFKRA